MIYGLPSAAGYAGLIAVAAGVGAFWNQLKSILVWPLTWFVVSASMDEDTGRILMWYLRKQNPEPVAGKMSYLKRHRYIRAIKRWGSVARESGVKGRVILYRWWIPVVISSESSDGGIKNRMKEPAEGDGTTFKVSSVRWAFDVEAMIKTALDAHNDHKEENKYGARHCIVKIAGKNKEGNLLESGADAIDSEMRYLGYGVNELGNPIPDKPFEHLAYGEDVMSAVDITQRWLKSKEWYQERSIPWRMGLLFDGVPGTGKTSCVRAIAQALDLPVYIVDLSDVGNGELTKAWAQAREQAPSIVLLEDVDRISLGNNSVPMRRDPVPGDEDDFGDQGRTQQKWWQPLTLDCLLNCISGLEPSDGILTIATANDISKLDPALTRPGRLDFRVTFQPLTGLGRHRVAENILGHSMANLALMDRLVDEGEGETGAQFVKRVSDTALRLYWDEFKPGASRS